MFEVAEKINEDVQPTIYSEFKPHQHNARELISKAYLIRSVSKLQAITILAERGMIQEGRIILRSLVETMFYVVAMAKNRESFKKVAATVFFEQKKIANNIQHWINDGYITETPELKSELEALREEACENIKNEEDKLKENEEDEEGELKEYEIWEIAKLADLLPCYRTAYRQLCFDVHASIMDLEGNVETGSAGDVQSMIFGPTDEGLDLLLLMTVKAMLSIYDGTRRIFKSTGPDLASKYSDTLERLAASIDKADDMGCGQGPN